MFPRRPRGAAASLVLALAVGACGSVEQPTPSPSPSGSVPTRTEQTLVVGVHIPVDLALGDLGGFTPVDLPLFSMHPNGTLADEVVRQFVYSGVYRLDDMQAPTPDLAAEPCAVSADLLLVTCRLREATFHDGTPVSARDVEFVYRLLLSDSCRPLMCVNADGGRLIDATAIDDRTVAFRLAEPDPAFITSILPAVLIEPRSLVEGAFAEFTQASRSADGAALQAVASHLQAALHPADPTACSAPEPVELQRAEQTIAGLGRALHSGDAYAGGGDCAYGEYLVRVLTDAADALRLTGIDAIAAAYRILKFPPTPVGSGPWSVRSIDPGKAIQLDAFARFHRGAPASAHVEVRLIRDTAAAIEAVRSGAVSWLLQPFPAGENLVASGLGDATGITWTTYNGLGFSALFYNLRAGRLFADRDLRAALELCIDKEETVAAATGGEGVPIYSPISPSMWAYEPNLRRPARDVIAGKRMIEAAGWTLGGDGIYRKGTQRMSTLVPVIEARPQNVHFMELLARQAEDCGMEIVPQPMTQDDLFAALTWPLVPPGGDQPWDAVFAGFFTTPDPDPSYLLHSRAVTAASQPDAYNFMGYRNDDVDLLLDEGRATYGARDRTRVYQRIQQILADDRPALFGWSQRVREARSDRLRSTRGALRTDTRTWWWQLETLVVGSPGP